MTAVLAGKLLIQNGGQRRDRCLVTDLESVSYWFYYGPNSPNVTKRTKNVPKFPGLLAVCLQFPRAPDRGDLLGSVWGREVCILTQPEIGS
jgi:hypothetical protein